MDNAKDILLLGLYLYVIIYMILWYKGKINLTEKQKERREKLLGQYNELLKGLIFLVLVSLEFRGHLT